MFKFWTLCVFEPLPLGGLGATYSVYLRLIGKLLVDFVLVLIELFSLGVTAEELRANIDWKSAFLKENEVLSLASFGPIFTSKGRPPANHFA